MDAHVDVIRDMEQFVSEQLTLLRPIEESWQPSDLLPKLNEGKEEKELKKIRRDNQGLSDKLLVVLVGNMVTEEALPSYQTWLNCLEGVRDRAGISQQPWAQWIRGWSAEENRHGDALNRYLYLTGRVDMRMVEVTIQHLIRNGFDPRTDNDPYKGFIYTSFQERATKICHGNVAKLATRYGDPLLAKICNTIAGDEARHEIAYKRFVGRVFELDPNGALLAFTEMMKRKITMPAKLIYDGHNRNLFLHFSSVAQQIGVYTTRDYTQIIQHLVNEWKVPNLSGLSSEASKAQEYLCNLARRYLRLAEFIEHGMSRWPKFRFGWIFNRSV